MCQGFVRKKGIFMLSTSCCVDRFTKCVRHLWLQCLLLAFELWKVALIILEVLDSVPGDIEGTLCLCVHFPPFADTGIPQQILEVKRS